jgi:hypothetical protein
MFLILQGYIRAYGGHGARRASGANRNGNHNRVRPVFRSFRLSGGPHTFNAKRREKVLEPDV